MGEKRYAIAYLYGYGQCQWRRCGYSSYYRFNEDSTIKVKGLNNPATVVPPFKRIQINRSGYKCGVDLYLVEEDGEWREYFTGSKINPYDLSNDRGTLIIRELVFGSCRYMTPKEFADAISRFSEEEKKDIAGQVLQLQKHAAVWSMSYDMAAERDRQMELEKERANKQAAEELEYGMGQYNNVTPEVSQARRSGCLTQILMVLAGVLSVYWLLFQ